MKTKIHLLPDDLIARIAAGEVVERPASVIKELVENSLDAGATYVSVSFEGAGRKKIIISDNGCGMTVGEAMLALQRHATSKISKYEDLESVTSFGFRGEALPSIAAVSRFKITTRSEDEEVGWEIVVEGGKVLSKQPVAREPGTTMEVSDIFFNTPARFKFLKSDQTERAQILRVMEEIIFSSPTVTFELQSEKTKPVVFSAGEASSADRKLNTLRDRLTEAWGARWSRGLQNVYSKSPHFSIHGVITNQGFHQATGRTQFLYVNRRPVMNRRLSRAVYEGYLGQLPSLRHPGWVLFVDVDPKTVDVNVHPSKREVKLTHESEIFSFVVSAVKDALKGTAEAPVEMFSSVARAEGPLTTRSAKPVAPSATPRTFDFGRPAASEPMSPAMSEAIVKNFLLPTKPEAPNASEGLDIRDPDLQVIGQIRQTYILAHTPQGFLIFDQHAAAEKAAYEALFANLAAKEPQVQMLLVPFTWEVALSVTPQIEENLELFTKMGFLLEPFGKNTFVLKGVPAHLGERFDLHSLLDGLSDALSDSSKQNMEHRIAAMTACKASVKAGDALDLKECRYIVQQLTRCEAPFTCPHGRPTVLRMSYPELERRFRRV